MDTVERNIASCDDHIRSLTARLAKASEAEQSGLQEKLDAYKAKRAELAGAGEKPAADTRSSGSTRRSR
jgi:hypothetical protein